MNRYKPPNLFLKFFHWFCHPKLRDHIEGDLLETYNEQLIEFGKRKADVKFIIDVLLLFRPGIIKPMEGNKNLNNYGMIKSYFKIGLRNLWRSKLHSILNITGLTFGIVCFLLIALYVFDELTFDQQHINVERIYRVVEHKNARGEASTIAGAGFKLAEESKNSIPEVESTTRMIRTGRANLVDPENPVPFQETVTIADEHFLEIFDFPLIEGDRHTALKEPASIIIDEDLAMRIFSRTDVMGKNLQFSHLNFPLKITGILKKHPRNSSFNFNCVMAESTSYNTDFFKRIMAGDWASTNFSVYAARRNFETVKDQMSKVASVKSVSVTSRVPGEWKSFRMVKARNEGSTDEPGVAYLFGADKDFLKTFEVTLLQGRNFREAYDSSSMIINETAAKMLNIRDVSEQIVEIPAVSRGDAFNELNVPFKFRVIGMVKDFHFQSLRDKIQPLILAYNNNPIHVIDYYSARISPTNIQTTLEKLKAIMVANDADDPFEYHFLDQQLALFYVEDERRQTLLAWTAVAAIFIACLGLFGLATYSTEQRMKEIGVRKVLGASVLGLVSLLSRDFLKLVLFASCIAFPIAWWATNRWLQEYAYHIELAWWIFILAGALATGIALLTIGYQAIKTAVANPVESLRSE